MKKHVALAFHLFSIFNRRSLLAIMLGITISNSPTFGMQSEIINEQLPISKSIVDQNNLTQEDQRIIEILITNKDLCFQLEVLLYSIKVNSKIPFASIFTTNESKEKTALLKKFNAAFFCKHLSSFNKSSVALQCLHLLQTVGIGILSQAISVQMGIDFVRQFNISSKLLYLPALFITPAIPLCYASKINEISTLLHNNMIWIANIVNDNEEIYQLIKQHPEFAKNFPEYNTINLSLSTYPETQELVSMLKTDTFKGPSSFFSFKGRVLNAFKKMENPVCINDFKKSFQVIQKLDAYVFIAKENIQEGR